jgi:hypothetical protein
MAQRSVPTLKTYFETGDIPTQQEFADFIDSSARGEAPINAQSGASYTVVYGDRGKLIDYTGTGAGTINLPPASTALANFTLYINNNRDTNIGIRGDGFPAGETVDGNAFGLTLKVNESVVLVCDGVSNWISTLRTIDETNVVTDGALTSGNVPIYNGSLVSNDNTQILLGTDYVAIGDDQTDFGGKVQLGSSADTTTAFITNDNSGASTGAQIIASVNGSSASGVGAIIQSYATGTNYAVQLVDGSEGSGKFLKDVTGSGQANWANITTADVTGAIDISGTPGLNQAARWTDANTLAGSTIMDIATTYVAIGDAQYNGGGYLNIDNTTINQSIVVQNSYSGGSVAYGANIIVSPTGEADNAVGILVNCDPFGLSATASYPLQLDHHTAGSGKFLRDMTGDGKAQWATISTSDISDITLGIADGNVPDIDAGATIVANDYAKFTATGLIGQTYAQVKTDLSLDNVENTALSTWAGSANITTVGTIGSGTWTGTAIASDYLDADTAHLGVVQTFTAKHSFTATASGDAGINVGSDTGAPTTNLANGDIYYNTTDNKLYGRINAAWVDLGAAGSGISNVVEDLTPQLGGMLDINGNSIGDGTNAILAFTEAVSPVNYFTMANSPTGEDIKLSATGTDANIDIDIDPKGTGNVLLGTMVFDADQSIGAGQDNYVLTYDNGTGLISLEAASGGSGDWTIVTRSSGTTYSASVGEMVIVASGAATHAITLPTASGNSGKRIGVKATVAPTDIEIYTTANETLDGTDYDSPTGLAINNQYDSYIFFSDGTNWFIES